MSGRTVGPDDADSHIETACMAKGDCDFAAPVAGEPGSDAGGPQQDTVWERLHKHGTAASCGRSGRQGTAREDAPMTEPASPSPAPLRRGSAPPVTAQGGSREASGGRRRRRGSTPCSLSGSRSSSRPLTPGNSPPDHSDKNVSRLVSDMSLSVSRLCGGRGVAAAGDAGARQHRQYRASPSPSRQLQTLGLSVRPGKFMSDILHHGKLEREYHQNGEWIASLRSAAAPPASRSTAASGRAAAARRLQKAKDEHSGSSASMHSTNSTRVSPAASPWDRPRTASPNSSISLSTERGRPHTASPKGSKSVSNASPQSVKSMSTESRRVRGATPWSDVESDDSRGSPVSRHRSPSPDKRSICSANEPAGEKFSLQDKSVSLDDRIQRIRDIVNKEIRSAGVVSFSTLSKVYYDLMNTCAGLATSRQEMQQHRSILAKEVEKAWSLCDQHARQKEELRKQVLLLQARNADMEKTNQQLMRRLNSAVDIALAEGTQPARPHAMSALDQRSETDVQYSLLTADATLEAKYHASSPRYAAQPRKASVKPRRRSLPGSPIKISIPSTPEVLLSWMPGRGHCQSQPTSSPMQLSLTPLTPRSRKSGCRSVHELLMARSHKTLEQNQAADSENHTLPATNNRKGLGNRASPSCEKRAD